MLQEIGRIVAAARVRAGCSIRTIAEETQVPEGIIEALENGTPGVTTTQLDRIAVRLGLEPGALQEGREAQLDAPSVFFRQTPFSDVVRACGLARPTWWQAWRVTSNARS